MTLNVWNYNRPWPTRRDAIVELIRTYQPTVIGLQETRHDRRFAGGKGQGEQIAELTGYHATFALGQVYVPLIRVDEGLTTLTRDSPQRVMQLQLSRLPREREDGNQRVCLGVRVAEDGTTFDFYNTHFSLSARAREINAIETARFVEEQSGELPAILVGDLNAMPDTLPIRFLMGEDLEKIAKPFVDCWALAHPDHPGYTYASNHLTHRVDYILARNAPWPVTDARIIGSVPIGGVYPSDHAGIVVDLETP